MVNVGRKNSIYYLILIGIFFVFCLCTHRSNAQDTTALSVKENEKHPIVHWQTVVTRWSAQLDSVKRRLAWVKNQSDTAYIDSALFFFGDARRQITQLEQQVKKAALAEEVVRKKEAATDTANVLDMDIRDSSRIQIAALADTLQRVEGSISRLLADLDYWEETTQSRRTELIAMLVVPPDQRPSKEQIIATVQKNWIKDGASTTYFNMSTWSSRLFLILLSIGYFYWIYRLGRRLVQEDEELRLHQNEPLWIPLLKAMIFFLILFPLASFSIPVFVLQISYFLIFVFLFLILYKELSPFKRRVNFFLLIYYVITVVGNLLLSELWWTRITAVCCNLAGILLLWSLGRRTDLDNPIGYLHRYVRWSIMVGHVLAITLILLGYLHMSRVWSLVVAIGLLQGLSLRAFRDMLLHDLQNQYEHALPNGWFKRFDKVQLLKSFDRLIRLVCLLLILQVLVNGLHITREVSMLGDKLLNSPHKIGSLSFSYGDLLWAVAIIWIANWLQVNLKKLVDGQGATPKQTQKMALFPLFRLLIIVVGFLIGISILGLGVDKLTVIIGALSVGIGLGLQNIINNFVSGVILVFEKPFKIGDYVELADKKGQVMEIGIRSSTLLTDQGARVIIPNGDLLSGRLVNWTFAESDIRLNMQLTVEKKIQLEEWKEWLDKTIRSFEEVDQTIAPKIWTQGITADNYIVFVQVGVKNVTLLERFRSALLETIQQEMESREIKIASN